MIATPADVIEVYRRRPYSFAIDVLGQQPVDHQRQIMESVRDNRRTLVIACNSIGKDWLAGTLVLWWQSIWPECETITTAPTGDQVRLIQWKEIRGMWEGATIPLGGDFPDVMPEWRLGPKRFAFGRATNTMEKISGHHSPHQLIIITEGSAVQQSIYDGVRSLMASGDAHLLVITNPTMPSGECYDAATGKISGYNVITVGAEDTPNIKACRELGEHQIPDECPNPYPFLITHQFVEEIREDFGEDSDYYHVHVDGSWPEAGEDSVIPLGWIENAMRREHVPGVEDNWYAGLDVARMGNDHSAVVTGRGPKLLSVDQWAQQDLPYTKGRARMLLTAELSLKVAIDDTGLGGGVAPDLQEEFTRERVYGVQFGGMAEDDEHYANKVSEMWMRLAYAIRDKLDLSTLRGHPLERRAIAQLTKAKKSLDAKGRIKVDKHGGGSVSPDIGDALALWNDLRHGASKRWLIG